MKTVAIIGAGAAGLMAAAQILDKHPSCQILLFEKNPGLGAKVIISGGGRCNITTALYRRKDLQSCYPRGSQWLRPIIGNFGPRKIMKWFESKGLPLHIQTDNRVFPASNRSHDVVDVFEQILNNPRVRILRSCSIQSFSFSDSIFSLKDSLGNQRLTQAVVLATGGQAYRQTGSTGDAYAWLEQLGHTITPLGPSLNSFLTQEKWIHDLSGMSFAHVEIYYNNFQSFVTGPLLCTHFGITGPVVFKLASHLSFERIDSDHPYVITIKFDSSGDENERKRRIGKACSDNAHCLVSTYLQSLFPRRFVQSILMFFSVPLVKLGMLTKKDRLLLANLLGLGVPFHLVSRRPGDEFVTAGGVFLDEIRSPSCSSDRVPGLFIVGELLDVDAYTGGFNLTSSRATGYCAAQGVVDFLE